MIQNQKASITKVFSQADFDSFALLSGDDNPIHTDPVFSANTRFGRTVAHGLLLCSVLRGLIDQQIPGGRLSETSLMFPAPTFTGEPMQFTIALIKSKNNEIELDLQVKRLADDVITCQGNARVMT